MRHKPRFRLWRPGRRSARRQVAALRAKTAQARMQLADTDAMLAAAPPRKEVMMRHIVLFALAVATAFWLAPAFHVLPQHKKDRG